MNAEETDSTRNSILLPSKQSWDLEEVFLKEAVEWMLLW